MAATVKCKWILKKCAKFLYNEDFKEPSIVQEEESNTLNEFCKGAWKLYSGEDKDLILSYLESDHILLTKQDIIMESFSLPCSRTFLRGSAKADSLLMSCHLQAQKVRRFRIQFDACEDRTGIENRKLCTDMLQKYIEIIDYDTGNDSVPKPSEVAKVNRFLFDKMKCRKGYSVKPSCDNLKEVLSLCLTDNTFPGFVAEVDTLLKDVGKL